MTICSRRDFFLRSGTALAMWSALPSMPGVANETQPRIKPKDTLGFGFSLYGMKSLAIDDALKACAEIGYDCVEIPVLADWPSDSRKLSRDEQRRIRASFAERRLRLSALMENLPLLADKAKHADNLERLKLAGELAHALSPGEPAVIELVVGGSPAKWPEVKEQMVERLQSWAEVATAARTVIAVKPHVGNALHTPADAAWLVQQINSPWLKAAFDYSHFALRKLDLEQSVKTLIPHSAFVHVKDETGDATKFQFLLPGAGTTDYPRLLRGVFAAGYRGDIVVEVSGQIHTRPGYEPLAAAKSCYAALAPAFKTAGLKRG